MSLRGGSTQVAGELLVEPPARSGLLLVVIWARSEFGFYPGQLPFSACLAGVYVVAGTSIDRQRNGLSILPCGKDSKGCSVW
jgi:hypothetical protein